MVPVVGNTGERLATTLHGTFVRSLAGVRPDMNFSNVSGRETFVASLKRAQKRFFT